MDKSWLRQKPVNLHHKFIILLHELKVVAQLDKQSFTSQKTIPSCNQSNFTSMALFIK